MCDTETKARFKRVDDQLNKNAGALDSLTNDMNTNDKEMFRRLGKLETGHAVLATKMDSVVDKIEGLSEMFAIHIKEESVIFDKEEVRLNAIESTIDKAKFMIAGGALMLSVIWAGMVAVGTALWQWFKNS